MDERQAVEVAAGILIRADGAVLLARRPAIKVYAGYWEFPGGKVESGETPRQALVRELFEELGVDVSTAYPWINRTFSYPHSRVKLHFFQVPAWTGDLHAREHDALAWHRPRSVDVAPLLPANGPILDALALPREYGISQAEELGTDVFLERLRRALHGGLRLVQVREPAWNAERIEQIALAVIAEARPFGAKVLLHSDAEMARRVGADGVHLKADQLMRLSERPDLPIIAASCHNVAEREQAERLALNFCVMGPVKPTASHPESRPIGWPGFSQTIQGSSIPVFALGGLGGEDLGTARQHGAHGVAMVRAAWNR